MNVCETPITRGPQAGQIPKGTLLGRQRHSRAKQPLCDACEASKRRLGRPSTRTTGPKLDWSVLVPKAQAGDQAATQEILDGTKGLQVSIARKAAGADMWTRHREDLLSAAAVGVLEAIRRYDPDHPSSLAFSTVVGYRIQQEVWQYVVENAGAVGITRWGWRHANLADQAARERGDRPANEFSDNELEAVTGQPITGAAVRARMDPTPLGTFDGADDPLAGVHDDHNGELTDVRVIEFLDDLARMPDHDRQLAAERFVTEWDLPVTAEDLLGTMDQVYGSA